MVAQVTDPDLGERLGAEPLTFYVGFDATADSLHVGSLLPLMVIARLRRPGTARSSSSAGGPPSWETPAARTPSVR